MFFRAWAAKSRRGFITKVYLDATLPEFENWKTAKLNKNKKTKHYFYLNFLPMTPRPHPTAMTPLRTSKQLLPKTRLFSGIVKERDQSTVSWPVLCISTLNYVKEKT